MPRVALESTQYVEVIRLGQARYGALESDEDDCTDCAFYREKRDTPEHRYDCCSKPVTKHCVSHLRKDGLEIIWKKI